MINKRILSTLLALAILLSCVGWTPVQAQGTAPEEETIDNVTQTLDNEDSPEYVDAEQFEEAGHVQRLYDEEGLDTYVYLNADGSKSVYYMDQDVKFIDEQGNVREKDTALVRKERGYGMHSNDVGLHIPDSAADGITVSHKSREVKLLPVGGTGLAAANNNSILYSNFFGRGIHLQYTPMLSGVKEDVIITQYTGVNSFSFLLETGGLYLFDADGRYYLAESATAKAAFYLGEVLVYDAIGRPDMGTMAVETVTPGQCYKLTISADEAFLTDPETLYPVTIDPTLTVSDNTHSTGAIQDAPVFSGKPSKNFGSYVYNTIGYHSADYGTAMTVVRLAGLLSDDIYESLSESNIENVTFYMKDGGSSSAAVNIHAVTGSATWTESNVTYSNLGAYSTAIYATDTMGGGGWGEFNITYLVRLWKNGTLNPQRGFVMAISDSTKKIGALSSEYSNTDYRPYVVVTYTLPPGIEIAVDEGDVIQLNTNMTGEITWTSSDESLATVSSYGLVEGIRAGKVTITASCSNHEFSTYTVYVTVPDGVYYFKNQSSNLCLQGTFGRLHINSQKSSQDTRLNQLWKITYLQNGQYVIRPMQNLSRALTVDSGGYVAAADAAITDSAVTSAFRWSISYNTSGYAIQQNGSSSKTVIPVVSSMPDSAVYAGAWSESASCHWNLQEAYGIFLRDTTTLETIDSSLEIIFNPGECKSLEALGISYEYYGALHGGITWSSSNQNVATINARQEITGNDLGRSTITLGASLGELDYSQSFQLLCVYEVNLEVIYDQAYLTRYTNAVDRINNQMAELRDLYLSEFYILIHFSQPEAFSSYADIHCYSSPTANCDHSIICSNSRIFDDGTIIRHDYHHKNIYNIAARIPFPDITETFKIAYIGHAICWDEPNEGCSRNNNLHMYGCTWSEYGLMIITNHISVDDEIKTTVHEFGHMYGAIDHYGEGTSSTDEIIEKTGNMGYSRYCIYGEEKSNVNVLADLTICDGCRDIIISNLRSYHHN